jgi:hypothetical protein
VLRECLLSSLVEQVLVVGRASVGVSDPKLREIVRPEVGELAPVESELVGYDACFFCLGVSSVGMNEADYRRVTYDLTLSVARVLARVNPQSVFIYVSGAGTDSSERGRSMWARVKGATENAVRELPLRTYFFRPGYIQPLHGVTSKTRLYSLVYRVVAPLYPLLRRVFPRYVNTTEAIGRAMLAVAEQGGPSRVLTPADINLAADT